MLTERHCAVVLHHWFALPHPSDPSPNNARAGSGRGEWDASIDIWLYRRVEVATIGAPIQWDGSAVCPPTELIGSSRLKTNRHVWI